MKTLRERQIGERFKYRKNIVEVKSVIYNKCFYCQFRNQSKWIVILNGCYQEKNMFDSCSKKHNCSRYTRKDKKDVYFKLVKRLYLERK